MRTVSSEEGLGPEANFLGLDVELADPRTAPVIVVPVPFERTSSFAAGSASGPAAILRASREVELFDVERQAEPVREFGGVATLPPLEIPENWTGQELSDHLEKLVAQLQEQGKFVVTLGAEHTSVVGAIRASVRRYPDVTILQLDAHHDLRQQYLGDPWSHACAMSRVLDPIPAHLGKNRLIRAGGATGSLPTSAISTRVDKPPVAPGDRPRPLAAQLVQVAIRSACREEWESVGRQGLTVFYGGATAPLDRWVDQIISRLGDQVYVTLDCDCLDPSIMPAVGTPEPDGLNWPEVTALLKQVACRRQLVGMDVSELAPVPGMVGPQYLVAKLIYRVLSWHFLG